MKISRKEVISNISKVIFELNSLNDIINDDINDVTDIPVKTKFIIDAVDKQADKLITLKYLLKYNLKH